ncbi:MAG: GspMb/PilO family protein, partial [Vicinamibacterales bacterium]
TGRAVVGRGTAMRAIFSVGSRVPLARVLREHRKALVPLGIVLAINVIVLAAVVLPLSQRVVTSEARAESADRAQAAAAAEFKQAGALRDGKTRASADLETFYRQVLPADAAVARRITHVKPQQRAREQNVRYERGATNEEEIDDSVLERQTVSMTLSGDYDDLRAFIYTLETSPDFVVIDNVGIAEGSGTDAPLSLSLELSTYYRTSRAVAARTRSSGR